MKKMITYQVVRGQFMLSWPKETFVRVYNDLEIDEDNELERGGVLYEFYEDWDFDLIEKEIQTRLEKDGFDLNECLITYLP